MSLEKVLDYNYVVIVNARESEALQNLAFMCGYHWRYRKGQDVSYLDKEVLVFNTDGTIEFIEFNNKICDIEALKLTYAKHQRPCNLAKKLIKMLRN